MERQGEEERGRGEAHERRSQPIVWPERWHEGLPYPFSRRFPSSEPPPVLANLSVRRPAGQEPQKTKRGPEGPRSSLTRVDRAYCCVPSGHCTNWPLAKVIESLNDVVCTTVVVGAGTGTVLTTGAHGVLGRGGADDERTVPAVVVRAVRM